MGKEPRRYRRRGLPFPCRPAADCQSVINALVEIDKRMAEGAVRVARRDSARPRACIQADQDEPRQMPKGPLVGCNRMAFLLAAMDAWVLTVSPERPYQLGSLF